MSGLECHGDSTIIQRDLRPLSNPFDKKILRGKKGVLNAQA